MCDALWEYYFVRKEISYTLHNKTVALFLLVLMDQY